MAPLISDTNKIADSINCAPEDLVKGGKVT